MKPTGRLHIYPPTGPRSTGYIVADRQALKGLAQAAQTASAGNFGFETIHIDSLKDYVDLINCCKTFISLNSGPHMLAGSIRHINKTFRQICIMSSHSYYNTSESWFDYQMRTKFFVLPLVNYIKI